MSQCKNRYLLQLEYISTSCCAFLYFGSFQSMTDTEQQFCGTTIAQGRPVTNNYSICSQYTAGCVFTKALPGFGSNI
jgi:hypothetical protein